MNSNDLKKLAIYYAWPSCVRGLSEEQTGIEHAIEIFSSFDILVLGDGLQSPKHGDHDNTKSIIERLSGKEIQGYVHLSMCDDFPTLSDEELVEKLQAWKNMGMTGVLFDLIHPQYGASVKRVAKIATAAHDIELHVSYNSELDAVSEGWLEERITPVAQADDLILLEKFGTSWAKKSYPIPETLPQQIVDLQNKGIVIVSVSTYDAKQVSVKTSEGRGALMKKFLKYRAEATRLKLDGYQFTNGLYSASGPEANILVDFDALVTQK